MLMSVGSWIFFVIGCIMLVIAVILAGGGIFTRGLDGDDRALLLAVAIVLGIFGGLIAGVIGNGGIDASRIQNDLTQQGFTVVSMNLDANKATVVQGNELKEVQVYKVGYPAQYRAYLTCPADANFKVTTEGCAATPK